MPPPTNALWPQLGTATEDGWGLTSDVEVPVPPDDPLLDPPPPVAEPGE